MNHNILWTLSLLTICIIVIIWTVCNFAGNNRPVRDPRADLFYAEDEEEINAGGTTPLQLTL